MLYFGDNQPHTVEEVVCLKCLHRWVAVYNSKTLLKDLECPNCGNDGFIIATGQSIEAMEENHD